MAEQPPAVGRTVYIAGPLFTPAEREYLEGLAERCERLGLRTYLPHRDAGVAPGDGSSTEPFFRSDVEALDGCSVVLAVLNGADVDSGTAFELGYAFARRKTLVGLYEDTRVVNPLADLNLMITSSVVCLDSRAAVEDFLRSYLEGPAATHTERRVREEDIRKVVHAVGRLKLELSAGAPSTFGHDTAALNCLDAVLSINRRYKRFVKPRLERFRLSRPNVRELAELRALIGAMGPERFGRECLDYRDPARVQLLERVVDRLVEVSRTAGDRRGENGRLRTWAVGTTAEGYKTFGVRGVGMATYQYLRMLFGADTVKPDVHLGRFIRAVLGRASKPSEVITLIEAAAGRLGIPALALDHAIWRRSSRFDE